MFTLNHALRTLYSIPEPNITYTQRLDIRKLFADLSYSSYLLHNPEHEIITLTFPRECERITRLSNNHGCKMVYYMRINGFLQEIQITSDTVIEVDSTTSITIYTRSKPDLIVTFNMTLSKSIRSKL